MREVEIEVTGDENVRGVLHEADDPRGGLLMVHGMLSSHREFRDAPEALAKRGWTTLALDLRGHGASDGERGHVSLARALQDLGAAREFLREQTGDVEVGILGHSLGAAWTTSALAELEGFACGVLVAPLRRILDEVGALEHLLYRLAHGTHRLKTAVGLGPLYVPYRVRYRDLFSSVEAIQWAEEEAFLQRRANLRSYRDYLEVDTAAWARQVELPVLVVVPTRDHVLTPARMQEIHDALAGPKELLEVNAGHSVLADEGWDDVVDEVDRFLGEHLAG